MLEFHCCLPVELSDGERILQRLLCLVYGAMREVAEVVANRTGCCGMSSAKRTGGRSFARRDRRGVDPRSLRRPESKWPGKKTAGEITQRRRDLDCNRSRPSGRNDCQGKSVLWTRLSGKNPPTSSVLGTVPPASASRQHKKDDLCSWFWPRQIQ